MCARLFNWYNGATGHGSCNRRTELSPSSPNVGEHLSHADTELVPAWKQELNERLAATRTRRLRNKEEQIALPGLEHVERKVDSRASLLAAKVARRYANAPSYSEVLAAETRARAEVAPVALPASEDTSLSSKPTSKSSDLSLSTEEVEEFRYSEVL